jgi:hypothetical protein
MESQNAADARLKYRGFAAKLLDCGHATKPQHGESGSRGQPLAGCGAEPRSFKGLEFRILSF